MGVCLKNVLSVVLVSLALSPCTAPFSTYDVKSHSLDLRTPQAEWLSAKTSLDEDTALIGSAPPAPHIAMVFVRVVQLLNADESSKHQIPSRILRL